MRLLGVEFAPLRLPLHRRLETLATVYYSLSFLCVGILGIVINFYLLLCTHLCILPIVYFAWYICDLGVCNRGGRRSTWTRNWTIWRYLRDYFPVELVKTCDLDPTKNYIFGYHPHGIMCVGAFCNFATEATRFSETFPGITPHLLALQGQFWFPLHRELLLSTGMCSSTKESFEWIFSKKGEGNAAVLVVGGAVEALDAHPGSYKLTLNKRKGFIRMALKHGVSLVPVFSFGENDLFVQAKNEEGTLLRRVQTKLTKVLGFAPPLFHGRGIFQYNCGCLPFRRRVVTVVGKPIHVKRKEAPTQEDIEQLHAEYANALTQLFYEHKGSYAPSSAPLLIA
ncbi:2-acylglycerol O-acyltransferase 1-like [Ornithodoros turicata]|uniref:2-acylglycerol O-acyltransferase 1-like n=1 Tax=Ornithodoros turicata TaxID=34597 RepID=UPI0031398455